MIKYLIVLATKLNHGSKLCAPIWAGAKHTTLHQDWLQSSPVFNEGQRSAFIFPQRLAWGQVCCFNLQCGLEDNHETKQLHHSRPFVGLQVSEELKWHIKKLTGRSQTLHLQAAALHSIVQDRLLSDAKHTQCCLIIIHHIALPRKQPFNDLQVEYWT